MSQPAKRFPSTVHEQISVLARLFASRIGSLVDTVLRGLDRILGGLSRPALEPVPARVPASGARRRA